MSDTARNIEMVKRFYAAGPAERDEEREQYFAPDAVWHVPGNNPVSGDDHGVEAIATDIGADAAARLVAHRPAPRNGER